MLAWPRLINAILQNFPSPAADDFLRRQLLETGNTTLAIPSDVRSEQSPRSRADRMISGQWLYFVNIQTGSGYRPRLHGGRLSLRAAAGGLTVAGFSLRRDGSATDVEALDGL